ncbi:glycosyltransferase [Alteromonas oceanisediminis]|uniref:glycosyltransferase n=1 Tax=Alteromonas oceanisediminis TaxID=2836180 RepID=UPI001BDA6D21|nr:glycosyltransferase [Alteromonas oceanisediminis]MBT0587617.1 glycosyltransferase [Alteromonas oceanisediminis]
MRKATILHDSAKPRVIAIVINSLEGGGAERVACHLLKWLHPYAQQHQVQFHLVLLDRAQESQQCPPFVQKACLDSKQSLLKSVRKLDRWVAQYQPDHIISFLTRSNIASTLVSKRHGIPCIISERVNTTSHLGNGLSASISKMLVRLCYPLANHIAAVSTGVADDLVENFGICAEKITVVYNAYEREALNRLADLPCPDLPEQPYILAAGRLTANKNFSLLLRAFARAALPFQLVILGQGDERVALEKLASDLGIKEKVLFAGFQKNPYPYFKHATFFASSSNAEGFPNAIVEAMTLGKAVVVTDCPSGPAEILGGQGRPDTQGIKAHYGILCPCNEETALSEGLQLMAQPQTRQHYECQATRRAATFTPERMVDSITHLIESTGSTPRQRQRSISHV